SDLARSQAKPSAAEGRASMRKRCPKPPAFAHSDHQPCRRATPTNQRSAIVPIPTCDGERGAPFVRASVQAQPASPAAASSRAGWKRKRPWRGERRTFQGEGAVTWKAPPYPGGPQVPELA